MRTSGRGRQQGVQRSGQPRARPTLRILGSIVLVSIGGFGCRQDAETRCHSPAASVTVHRADPLELQRLEHPVLAEIAGDIIDASLVRAPLTTWYRAQVSQGRKPTDSDIRRRRADLARQHLVEELVTREARRRNLPAGASDEQLIAEFKRTLGPYGLSDHEARTGETSERVVARLRAEHRLAQFATPPPVDDAAIRAWYDQHRSRFVTPAKVRTRYIRLPLRSDASASSVAAVRNLLSEAARSKEFPSPHDLASKGLVHARLDEETKIPSELAPEFGRWLRTASLGETSPVVRTSNGFEVRRLVQRMPSIELSLEHVAPRIRAQLSAARAAAQRAEVLRSLVAEWRVVTPLLDAIAEGQSRSGSMRSAARRSPL